jgi:copper chaperone CopZ
MPVIIWGMTQLDVLYRYEYHPSESVMLALGKLREVYGIRSMKLDPEQRTILVEYDGTRLTNRVVAELLRRAGLSLEEEVSLIPPQPPAEAATPALAPSK